MGRFDITKKVGNYSIIGNIFLLIIKAIIGFISKSQAMIADAANSAGDIFASVMTAIGNIEYKFVGCDYTGFKLIKLSK